MLNKLQNNKIFKYLFTVLFIVISFSFAQNALAVAQSVESVYFTNLKGYLLPDHVEIIAEEIDVRVYWSMFDNRPRPENQFEVKIYKNNVIYEKTTIINKYEHKFKISKPGGFFKVEVTSKNKNTGEIGSTKQDTLKATLFPSVSKEMVIIAGTPEENGNIKVIARDEFEAETRTNILIGSLDNKKPVFKKNIPDKTVRIRYNFKHPDIGFLPLASDPDNNIIRYRLLEKPFGIYINKTTGQISGNVNKSGKYIVKIDAYDGYESEVTNYNLQINDYCGDGKKQNTGTGNNYDGVDKEQCDGLDGLDNAECPGEATCNNDCTLNCAPVCILPNVCGNNIAEKENGEVCDGASGIAKNPTQSSKNKQYACVEAELPNECTYTGGWCGDKIIQANYGEQCDGGSQFDSANNCPAACSNECALVCISDKDFCTNNGGKLSTVTECGAITNTCLLTDGTQCRLRDYAKGQCGPGSVVNWGEACSDVCGNGAIEEYQEDCDGTLGVATSPKNSSKDKQYACIDKNLPNKCRFTGGWCGDGIVQDGTKGTGSYGEHCDSTSFNENTCRNNGYKNSSGLKCFDDCSLDVSSCGEPCAKFEICGNNIDDDCNGEIDDNCVPVYLEILDYILIDDSFRIYLDDVLIEETKVQGGANKVEVDSLAIGSYTLKIVFYSQCDPGCRTKGLGTGTLKIVGYSSNVAMNNITCHDCRYPETKPALGKYYLDEIGDYILADFVVSKPK